MTGHGRRSKERNEWREELEAEHRPKQVQRRLTERRRQSYLGDAILLPLVPLLIPNLTADTRFVASAVAAGIAFFAVGRLRASSSTGRSCAPASKPF